MPSKVWLLFRLFTFVSVKSYVIHVVHPFFTFFLAGKVGDWKNYFTVAQNEAFDALVTEKMSGCDQEAVYEL